MRGYIDTTAAEIRRGDTIIEPWSGVLASVESIETLGDKLAIHMRGSVSTSYMGLTCEPDRVLRRAPRSTEARVEIAHPAVPVSVGTLIAHAVEQLCACGIQSRKECAVSCVKG